MTEVLHPSKEWVQEERLQIICKIISGLNPEKPISSKVIYDVQERIYFLTTQCPEFLEANRDAILYGQ